MIQLLYIWDSAPQQPFDCGSLLLINFFILVMVRISVIGLAWKRWRRTSTTCPRLGGAGTRCSWRARGFYRRSRRQSRTFSLVSDSVSYKPDILIGQYPKPDILIGQYPKQTFSLVSILNRTFSLVSPLNRTFSLVSILSQTFSLVSPLNWTFPLVSILNRTFSLVSILNRKFSLVSILNRTFSLVSLLNQAVSLVSLLNQTVSLVSLLNHTVLGIILNQTFGSLWPVSWRRHSRLSVS